MKYLESVKLVQFFLFEKQDIQLKEITGIFGPNASGKSSLIDAVQIAMFGANASLVKLNAQADESKTTRNLRSYCLGMHDETKRARDNATTYITLVWRDSVTNEPTSMGVCIYASVDMDSHKVLGRYIVPGIELAMQDHLEIVDNLERPRAWETFRHQLHERSKVSGENPLFEDAERYIKASLLALRGTGGAPSSEAFKSAFRFALKMRFDKSIDRIVREDVLEARPTGIAKFKEVTESFRKLAQMVAQVKAKIEDGEKVELEFTKAEAASVRETTWQGLSRLAARELAFDKKNKANEARIAAADALHASEELLGQTEELLKEAVDNEALNRDLKSNHASHQKNGTLNSAIEKESASEASKTNDVRNGLSVFRNTLAGAAQSIHLESNAPAIKVIVNAINQAHPACHELTKDQLSSLLKPAIKEAERASAALFDAGTGISKKIEDAKSLLESNERNLERVIAGRSVLSRETEQLWGELRDNGLRATPVCDLVRVTDTEWQGVIEAYLGRNIEALLVEGDNEQAAFAVYRGLTGPRAIYGAKIVAASKQHESTANQGSVAELICGDHPAAVAYLRRRFGDMRRAKTDQEALAGARTLTQDGMIVQSGEYDRIRPVIGGFKIGGGDGSQKQNLLNEARTLAIKIRELESQKKTINELYLSLGNVTGASNLKYMLDACDAMHKSRHSIASLKGPLSESADEEYIQLGLLEAQWKEAAQIIRIDVSKLNVTIGGQRVTRDACIKREGETMEEWTQASAEAARGTTCPGYDRDFASKQWDFLLDKFEENYGESVKYCDAQEAESKKTMAKAIAKGSGELGTFKEKYREQGSVNADDWRNEHKWVIDLLKRLRETELSDFEAQMKAAFKASQETFRADVAIALSNNLDYLNNSMGRLNDVLNSCPVFSNGERYQFKRTVKPQLRSLMKFIKDIATHGPNDDLFGGAGEMPEEFKQLLDDKIAPGAAGEANPLDDYRAFFDFDIDILREDSMTKVTTVIGSLSKRLGTGSGGEHRAPLYVIAGAALASAYRLDSNNADGIRLILLDEAFNKMDTGNIVATMRYLEQLGLQVFMASPGDNLGTLTAFLHRYYDILRDAENSAMMIEGHDVSDGVREMFRSDLTEFNEDLVVQELASIRSLRPRIEVGATE